MFLMLLFILLIVGVLSIFIYWRNTKDLFHPIILIMPQVLFVYFAMPYYGLMFSQQEFLWRGGSWENLAEFQAIVLLMVFSLQAGIWFGSRGPRANYAVGTTIQESSLATAAVIFGFIGVGSWLYGLQQVGGFGMAYGRSYGGGWDDSGYVREAAQLGLVAVPLLMLARRSRGMSAVDWALVIVFISPLLLHGILGARRGPTFIALATVAASYFIMFRPRVPLLVGVCGAAATGLLLLFLVANRGAIYLGSSKTSDASVAKITNVMENWSGNEYLFSSAIYRYVEATGADFGGRRLLVHEIARIPPSSVWPTKYRDLSRYFNLDVENFKLVDGIPIGKIANVVGWQIANGAAPGFVGDFWLEFGMLAPFAIALVGWIYGRFWRMTRSNPAIHPIYVLFGALSIYLVTQGIDAWLFRCAIYAGPAWLCVKFLERRRSVRYMMGYRAMRPPRTN